MEPLLVVALLVLVIFGLTALTGAPYVPSHRSALKKVFKELRPLSEQDILVDIGSGDGTVLIQAAEHGAKAYGIEINPFLLLISYFRVRKYRTQVKLSLANLWKANFPDDTTIVYTFGDSRDIKKMYAKVQNEADRLGKPIEFLSYGFNVPGIEPASVGFGFYLYKLTPLHTGVA